MFRKALVFGSQYGGSQAGMQEEAIVDEDGTVFYDSVEAELHPDASPDGGILCTDETVMERQKSAVVDIMKSLGKKLLTGKFDLLKISLPVKIFEARSYLQKLCDPLAFPNIMKRAVTASSPEERLKWVVAYFVAGYHRAFLTWSKPFNPILGETWYARLPDGTEACMEQISHHPPVSAFQIIGPGKSYYFHGHSQPTVSYKTNGITSYAVGERQVEFLDGSVIDVSFPEYNVRNIVSSSTTRADISGKVDFIDKEHGLIASLQIGKLYGETGLLGRPDAVSGTLYRTLGDGHAGQVSRAVSGKLASGQRHGGGPSRLRSTSSNAILTHDPKTGHAYCGSDVFTPVATCRGNWLAYLDWDGDRYWTWATDRAEEWTESPHIPGAVVLPSDCSCRDDLRLLAEGDFVGSQEAKDRMENDQRRDAKNRPVPTTVIVTFVNMVFRSSKRSPTDHQPKEENTNDECYYDALEAQLHHYASSDGSLVCHDEVLMKRQKSVAVDIIKAIGKKLLSGKFDLLHVSLPVKIFAARSYLQATCDVFSYSCLLDRAVAASSPEERLKWVVTWAVAGYHRGFSMWGKPFNPILGETYHARLPDGTEACMEQISHHPPVSAFQIIGPGNSYYIHGTSQPRLMYKMNRIAMHSDGYRVIEFPSFCENKVTQIQMGLPTFSIKNVGSSTPQRADVCGKIDFVDTENHLVASIDIGELHHGVLEHGCVQGTLYKKSSHTLDHSKSGRLLMRDVSGSGSSKDDLYIPISTCRGHWLAYLDWDDDRYWTWATDAPQEWTATAKMAGSGMPVLPSDSTLREDLMYLAEEDFDRAQEAKERLENDQRRDAKNRPVHT